MPIEIRPSDVVLGAAEVLQKGALAAQDIFNKSYEASRVSQINRQLAYIEEAYQGYDEGIEQRAIEVQIEEMGRRPTDAPAPATALKNFGEADLADIEADQEKFFQQQLEYITRTTTNRAAREEMIQHLTMKHLQNKQYLAQRWWTAARHESRASYQQLYEAVMSPSVSLLDSVPFMTKVQRLSTRLDEMVATGMLWPDEAETLKIAAEKEAREIAAAALKSGLALAVEAQDAERASQLIDRAEADTVLDHDGAELYRATFGYAIDLEGLKTDLLAVSLGQGAGAELTIDPLEFYGDEGPPMGRWENIEAWEAKSPGARQDILRAWNTEDFEGRFDTSRAWLEDPTNAPWLKADDRVTLINWIETQRRQQKALMNERRDDTTEEMTNQVRVLDQGTIESWVAIKTYLEDPEIKSGTHYGPYYQLWDRYTRQIEAEAASAAATATAINEDYRDRILGMAYAEALLGDTPPGEILAHLSHMLPSNPVATRINPETGEEEPYKNPLSGLLTPEEFKVAVNWIESKTTDPIKTQAFEQLGALAQDSKIPEAERAVYLAEAVRRLDTALRRRQFIWNEEAKDYTYNAEYDQMKGPELGQLVENVWRGVEAQVRGTIGARIYSNLPGAAELSAGLEDTDRDVGIFGIHLWTVPDRDAVEELVRRTTSGEDIFAWAQDTLPGDIVEVMAELEVALRTRFQRQTGAVVLQSSTDAKSRNPMFWCRLRDGKEFWFRYRYEKRGETLVVQVYDRPVDAWKDVTLGGRTSDGTVPAMNYSGAGVW